MSALRLNQYALDNITPDQWEDAKMMVANKAAVFGHITGDGKTLLSIISWSMMPNMRRVLILGGKSSAATWRRQLKLWADFTDVEFMTPQNDVWDTAVNASDCVVHMTYAMFLRRMRAMPSPKHVEWDLVICDELHKAARSRKTDSFEQMMRIDHEYAIGMSATWASRGPQDLWAFLHFMDRKRFASFWKFAGRYCYMSDTGFGQEIYGAQNVEELRSILNGKYFIFRKGVGPRCLREQLDVVMNKKQFKAYWGMEDEMVAEFQGDVVIAPSKMAATTRAHQLAVVPFVLFPEIGMGAAIDDLLERVEDDPHTVIFTLFTAAIPIIKAALEKAGHKYVYTLVGGASPDEIDQVQRDFKKNRGIAICSVKFAESYRLDTTNTAYVVGYSWDPNENIQAEGRLRARDSILKTQPLVRYYNVEGTITEATKSVCNGKSMTMSEIFHEYANIRNSRAASV